MAQHTLLKVSGGEGVLRKKIIYLINSSSLKGNVENYPNPEERISEDEKLKITKVDIKTAKVYMVDLFERFLGKEGKEFLGNENLGWGEYNFEVFYFPNKKNDAEKWRVFFVA